MMTDRHSFLSSRRQRLLALPARESWTWGCKWSPFKVMLPLDRRDMFVHSWLVSSILHVWCLTVSFWDVQTPRQIIRAMQLHKKEVQVLASLFTLSIKLCLLKLRHFWSEGSYSHVTAAVCTHCKLCPSLTWQLGDLMQVDKSVGTVKDTVPYTKFNLMIGSLLGF